MRASVRHTDARWGSCDHERRLTVSNTVVTDTRGSRNHLRESMAVSRALCPVVNGHKVGHAMSEFQKLVLWNGSFERVHVGRIAKVTAGAVWDAFANAIANSEPC